ncbi:MAG: HAMP domain-containing sensor histidine kinase [Mycobacteriales bacterium]
MSARAGRSWRPVTLRTRLLAGILLLLIGGLASSDVAATAELRSFLIARVDQQLSTQRARFIRLLARGQTPHFRGLRTPAAAHDYVAYLTRSGQVVATFAATDPAAVDLAPPHLPLLTAAVAAARGATPFTVPAAAAAPGYRVVVLRVPHNQTLRYPPGGGRAVAIVAIAAPLSQVTATVGDLTRLDVAVSSVVVVVMLLVGVWVLRFGLRPISAMARAGQSIAEGDREQRLPVPHPGSELGRLASTLNQAFDERASSEERLRRFLADASHELRTPLTTVRAWADLYLEGGIADQPTLDLAMARIAEESARMGRLVDELLALAGQGGGAPDRVQLVDVSAVVSSLVADARIVAPDRVIGLSLPSPAESQRALVTRIDPDALRRVVLNLLTNAIQHTSPGTPIDVGLRRLWARSDVEAADWVELTVRDHGAGVPEGERERIFEPFVRLSADRSSDGVGLGLSIVRATLAPYGGTVAVADGETGGAVFRVRLPAEPVGSDAAQPG